MATVIAVRHGETTWNRDGRVQGWADAPLTERGRQQARLAGARLASARDVDRLVASDLRRTRETAAALGDGGLGVEPSLSRDWRERGFGECQGLTRAEIVDGVEGFDPGDSLFIAADVPGGEPLSSVRERVTGGFDRLRTDLGEGETAVVVTHGGPICLLLASVTGRDLSAVCDSQRPANCGLTEIDVTDEPTVVGRNDTTHLPDG